MNPLIQSLTEDQLRTDIPSFRPGDTVRVHAKVVEGTRERIQIFEGVVISRKGHYLRHLNYSVHEQIQVLALNSFGYLQLGNQTSHEDL